jgi:protoheme IX farnesyltransferase
MTMRPAQTLHAYIELTKPRILLLVIFTGLPVMAMAAEGWPGVPFAAVTLFGIALAAGAANSLNCYLERDRDALMERTSGRPLPAQQISPRAALIFALVLGVLSTTLLYVVAGSTAAALGVASILFYIFVYTVWIKPRSALNAVIGGAAGAAAPLIADAAVNGHVGAAGWLLFAIVFFWQPPHVWAIALFRKDDYERAGIPMMPSVVGDQPTRWRMLGYTLALVPVTLAPVLLGLLDWIYLAAAIPLDAWFVWLAVRVLRERTEAAARSMFHVSLIFLFALFFAMLLDRAILAHY